MEQLLLEQEQEETLDYAWTSNLGHWYWDIPTNHVTFNPLKMIALGYSRDEVVNHVPYQFFTDKLHPEDYDKTMQAMMDHLEGKSDVYEVEYRLFGVDGQVRWFYDRGKITKWDKDHRPLFMAGIVFDVSEKKRMELELINISRIDDLTQVANHRMLVETLKKSMQVAKAKKQVLSIAVLDIDNYKQINDTKGHLVGDDVLRQVATVMKQSIRDTDLVGRYGGDEFLIVFADTDLTNAAKICDRIRQKLEATVFKSGVRLSVSGGVSQYNNQSMKEFIQQADKLLYVAKRQGKNQIVSKEE